MTSAIPTIFENVSKMATTKKIRLRNVLRFKQVEKSGRKAIAGEEVIISTTSLP